MICIISVLFFFFFFFQAEDGIRDADVTGVQTCALPIFKNVAEPIIVLNFWASWCRPCLEEFPSLVQFQEKYKGKVKVIGINGDEENPRENALKTQKKYGLNFPSTLDNRGRIGEKFLINTYPVSIIFHQGKVIYVSKKLHNFMDESFLKMIDSHLK